MVSIASTLGTGSGIDTAKLIDDLVAADRAGTAKRTTVRQEALTARISALSQARAGLSAFAAAAAQLTASGRLGPQASVSDANVLTATVTGSASIAPVAVEVRRLAMAQVLSSVAMADPTAPVGQGTLMLTPGTLAVSAGVPTGLTSPGPARIVTIGPASDSLNGVRDAINALGGPVSASLVRDTSGYRLVLRGSTGVASGFTVDATESGGAGLARFGFTIAAPTMTLATVAADAEIAVDGVTLRRAGNVIDGAVPGLRLSLLRAVPGSAVSASAAVDTSAAKTALGDFVAAYNEMAALVTTPGDSGLRSLRDGLRAALRGNGTLGSYGVATQRDGTLTVDDARLGAALASDTGGLATLMTAISANLSGLRTRLTGNGGALTGAAAINGREQAALTADTARAEARATTVRDTLTRRFAGMDSAVAAYKSTASFLTQQVEAWTAARR